MNEFAEKNEIEWGEYRDLTSRARKQGEANVDLQQEQLEFDLATGGPRSNPAYYKGGDITDNQALSSTDNPVEGVRDMIEIRNNPNQKYGAPRGTMTEANIRRVEYTAPGMMLDEINAVSKKLKASPSYQRMFEKVTAKAVEQDMAKAYKDIIGFLDETGHSRLVDVPEKVCALFPVPVSEITEPPSVADNVTAFALDTAFTKKIVSSVKPVIAVPPFA